MENRAYWVAQARKVHTDELSWQELADLLEVVRNSMAELEESEPEDMESEAYEAWSERHELLEDLADDILDRLDQGAPEA